jgi:hypothetical protein
MQIYIPTKGRGPNKQKTYDRVAGLGHQTFLICPFDEVPEFQQAGYNAIGCPAERIGATRQWIVDNATDKKVLMLDDDLHQWAVRANGTTHYRKANNTDIQIALNWMEFTLEDYAHAGIGARLFANNQPEIVENGRITRAWGLRADIIKKYQLKFTCPVDDLEMTIQLLRAGYANLVTYETVQDQDGSQSPGGASTYRTLEYHNKCQEQIHHWHSQFTRLTTKTTQGGWFDGKPRKEVVIAWKKLTDMCHPTTIKKHPGYIGHKTRNYP